MQQKNCLGKPVFNNVNRLIHSSPKNNTVTNKIKYFPLGPQIALKPKWHYFFSLSTITTKLDIYIYKYKDDYILGSISNYMLDDNKFLLPFHTWIKFLCDKVG